MNWPLVVPQIQRSPSSAWEKLPFQALIYELLDLSPPDLEAPGRSAVQEFPVAPR